MSVVGEGALARVVLMRTGVCMVRYLGGVDAPDLAPDLRRGAAASGAAASGAARGWKTKGASRVQHTQAGQRRAFHRGHGLRCGRLWGSVQQVRRACAHTEEELQRRPLTSVEAAVCRFQAYQCSSRRCRKGLLAVCSVAQELLE